MSAYPGSQTAALDSKRREYGDVWTFAFRSAEPVAYEAGQYVHVKLHDDDIEKRVRELSFASAPSDPELVFSMHIRDESAFKQRFGRLERGEEVTLFKIKGSFTLPETAERPLLFIAGGIAVTPYRSMLRELLARRLPHQASMLHVSGSDYLFERELSALPYAQQRIRSAQLQEQLQSAVAAQPEAICYVAGALGFLQHVAGRLTELGVPEARVLTDEFEGYDTL